MVSRRQFLSGVAALTASTAASPSMVLAKGVDVTPSRDAASAREPVHGQARESIVAWLDQHSAELTSLDFDTNDFNDLAAFRAAVGDARVVMLGEQTHHEGTTFEAKARLVRFLHEEMDFDVLAFESGFYEMRNVWNRIRGGDDAREAVRGGMLWHWAYCRQVLPLIDYLGERASSPRPLELAGFDCQFTRGASQHSIADGLMDFIARQRIDVGAMAEWPRFLAVLRKLEGDAGVREWKPTADDRDLVLETVDLLAESVGSANGPEVAFWHQVLRSLKAQTQSHYEQTQEFTLAGMNRRDIAMADNLIWLAREAYRGRKIIVWAGTYHGIRNPHLIHDPDLDYGEAITMGHLVWQALGDAVYTVACTAYEGSFGGVFWDSPMSLEPAPAESLEGLWATTTHDRAFLDLRRLATRGAWLHAPQLGRLAFGYRPVTAEWSRVVDGVVFLRTMRPATRAK